MGQKQANKKSTPAGKKDASGSGGTVTVVLTVDLHCEGCAHKVKNTIKRLPGVESVETEIASKKITVIGKVDPAEVKKRVEEKTKKNVVLVSPQVIAKKEKDAGGKNSEEPAPVADKEKKAEQKKSKEAAATTVVLKTRVHCDGCAVKINKIISKCEGVKEVSVDLAKDQVIIKGTMNMKELMPYLNTKLKREVEIVPPTNKDENKKPKDNPSGGGDNKKGKEVAKPNNGGEGDKKKGEEGSKPATTSKAVEENTSKIEVVNKMEYYGYPYGNEAYTFNPHQAQQGNGYVAEYWNGPDYMHASDSMNAPPHYLHAPQMFSDENPNACSIM